MNRPKLIRIHTIKGLRGLRAETFRPSLSALRCRIPAPFRFFLCSEILLVTLCLVLFAGTPVVDAKIVCRIGDDIYAMNDDGSGLRRLTNNTLSKDGYPRWSPDGNRIAFHRFMDREDIQTSSELFVMNADGTDQKRLTDNDVGDAYPSWSPDGQYLAFDSKRGGNLGVYVIELASQKVQRLTGIEDELGTGVPDWSPSGTEIAYEKFLSNGGGLAHKNIYLMDADGDNQRPLLPDPEEGVLPIIMRFSPRWSGDGQRILFDDCPLHADGQKCIPTVKRIGGLKQEITAIKKILGDNTVAITPCWMDNDRAIIFSLKVKGNPNANYDLYRYVLASRSLRRLTRDARDVRFPDWIEGSLSVSPKGKLPTRWGEIKHSQTGGDGSP